MAHRGYISVFDLKDAVEIGNKGLWVQHLNLKDHHQIRELFLLKKDMTVEEYETSHLRCHSKPTPELNRQYIFGILTGSNVIKKLRLSNGKLEPICTSTERSRMEQIEVLL